MSFLYLIEGGGRYKIGFSKHPESRLGQLQTASPDRLSLLFQAPGTRADERVLHLRFDHLRYCPNTTLRVTGQGHGA